MLQIANQEIQNFSQWLYSNKLTLNASKTNLMTFKTRKKRINMPVRITIKHKKTQSRLHRQNFLVLELMNI